MAKPSKHMAKVLAYLSRLENARLTLHYSGKILYYVSLQCDSPEFLRISKATHRAFQKRGWLEFDKRRDSGGLMGELPDGSQGIVSPSFNMDYKLSEEGRKIADSQ